MAPSLRFTLDGQAVDAQPGDTLAAALLRARITTFTRSIKYHRPRGPFCLQGSCGQCLMRVDGVPSVPACRVPVEEGMKCERQNAALGFVETDVFRAADFLFPDHLDHHHLMIQSRLLGKVTLEVARRLAGLGELPDKAKPAQPAPLRKVQTVVIGAGPAGLSAARAAAEMGQQVVLLEREARPGGSTLLRLGPPDPDWAAETARAFKGELMTGADCVGLYPNDTSVAGNAMLAVRARNALQVIVADRVVVAAGGVSQPLPFPGVDRPGVYAARGLLMLYAQCRVRVGEELVVVGEEHACAAALRDCGYSVVREVDSVKRALGNPVRAVDLSDGERVRCDAVALAHEPAPLHELASGAGAKAVWTGTGFAVECDADGRTAVPWLFVAGRVAGKPPIESGEAAGRAQ